MLSYLCLLCTSSASKTLSEPGRDWKPPIDSRTARSDLLSESGSCGDGVTYTFTQEEQKMVISGSGAMTDYPNASVPWSSCLYAIATAVIEPGVTHIGNYAFSDCSSLVSVSIGGDVVSIGRFAFAYCSMLNSVALPDAVTSIGYGTFSYCITLGEVNIPSALGKIDDYLFLQCSNLTCALVIPESVTSIGSGAFSGCSCIRSVKFPSTITKIGEYAFYECLSLSGTLTIPSAVDFLGSYAFCGCSQLTKIVVEDGVTVISDNTFYDCNRVVTVTFGAKIPSIGAFSFFKCSSLNGTLTIPDSVKSIGEAAFWSCTSLSRVHIGDGVISIGERAFVHCPCLTWIEVDSGNTEYKSSNGVLYTNSGTTVLCCPAGMTGLFTIPDSVSTIQQYSFYECIYLTSVIIPFGVKTISADAFFMCSSLKDLAIPGSVETIGANAFDRCSSLTEIVIPASVKLIDGNTFFRCYELSSIQVSDENQFYKSIDGVLFNKIGTSLINYPCNKAGDYTVPDSVTIIEEYAFHACIHLTSIIIPESVTLIDNYAFQESRSLSAVEYRGLSDPGNVSAGIFHQSSVTFACVPIGYQGSTFCGLNIQRETFVETTRPWIIPLTVATTLVIVAVLIIVAVRHVKKMIHDNQSAEAQKFPLIL